MKYTGKWMCCSFEILEDISFNSFSLASVGFPPTPISRGSMCSHLRTAFYKRIYPLCSNQDQKAEVEQQGEENRTSPILEMTSWGATDQAYPSLAFSEPLTPSYASLARNGLSLAVQEKKVGDPGLLALYVDLSWAKLLFRVILSGILTSQAKEFKASLTSAELPSWGLTWCSSLVPSFTFSADIMAGKITPRCRVRASPATDERNANTLVFTGGEIS